MNIYFIIATFSLTIILSHARAYEAGQKGFEDNIDVEVTSAGNIFSVTLKRKNPPKQITHEHWYEMDKLMTAYRITKCYEIDKVHSSLDGKSIYGVFEYDKFECVDPGKSKAFLLLTPEDCQKFSESEFMTKACKYQDKYGYGGFGQRG